jgi:hypothetical protein
VNLQIGFSEVIFETNSPVGVIARKSGFEQVHKKKHVQPFKDSISIGSQDQADPKWVPPSKSCQALKRTISFRNNNISVAY